MNCAGCSRRTAVLGLVLLATPRAFANSSCEKGLDLGPVTSFAVGAFKLIEADFGRAIVARDAKGLYAMSAMCTHMGGSIGLIDDKGTTVCPSHQSMFGANGEVIRGPAARPLPHFAVKVCEGRAYLDPFTLVAADTRV